MKLNITGEWGSGKSRQALGITGGREVNFAITVQADGRVRLDAVNVNEILDVSVAKVAARVMGMFESAVGVSDEIEMVAAGSGQAGLAGLP